jgi:hypothetical protein
MGIFYENLDERNREFMIQELDLDISNGRLYISLRLNSFGQETWSEILREAMQNYNDDWLAHQLLNGACFETHEPKLIRGRTTMCKVPKKANETLAEGQFNCFYARGLCLKAIEDGIPEVEVYRGKRVKQPRPESEAKTGTRRAAKALLDDLRESRGVDPALGIPSGPNSGLTVRLPR